MTIKGACLKYKLIKTVTHNYSLYVIFLNDFFGVLQPYILYIELKK